MMIFNTGMEGVMPGIKLAVSVGALLLAGQAFAAEAPSDSELAAVSALSTPEEQAAVSLSSETIATLGICKSAIGVDAAPFRDILAKKKDEKPSYLVSMIEEYDTHIAVFARAAELKISNETDPEAASAMRAEYDGITERFGKADRGAVAAQTIVCKVKARDALEAAGPAENLEF